MTEKCLSYQTDAGDKDETICYSYDIADPTKPVLIGKARQDGILQYIAQNRQYGICFFQTHI